MIKKLFELGATVTTPSIAALIKEDQNFLYEVSDCLRRHVSGDYSAMDVEDILANFEAIIGGFRVFSAYDTSKGRIWIITEADRSSTTIMFPDEY